MKRKLICFCFLFLYFVNWVFVLIFFSLHHSHRLVFSSSASSLLCLQLKKRAPFQKQGNVLVSFVVLEQMPSHHQSLLPPTC